MNLREFQKGTERWKLVLWCRLNGTLDKDVAACWRECIAQLKLALPL